MCRLKRYFDFSWSWDRSDQGCVGCYGFMVEWISSMSLGRIEDKKRTLKLVRLYFTVSNMCRGLASLEKRCRGSRSGP